MFNVIWSSLEGQESVKIQGHRKACLLAHSLSCGTTGVQVSDHNGRKVNWREHIMDEGPKIGYVKSTIRN